MKKTKKVYLRAFHDGDVDNPYDVARIGRGPIETVKYWMWFQEEYLFHTPRICSAKTAERSYWRAMRTATQGRDFPLSECEFLTELMFLNWPRSILYPRGYKIKDTSDPGWEEAFAAGIWDQYLDIEPVVKEIEYDDDEEDGEEDEKDKSED